MLINVVPRAAGVAGTQNHARHHLAADEPAEPTIMARAAGTPV